MCQSVTPLLGPSCIAGCTEVPYYGRPKHSMGFVPPHTDDSSKRLVGRLEVVSRWVGKISGTVHVC